MRKVMKSSRLKVGRYKATKGVYNKVVVMMMADEEDDEGTTPE